MRNLILAVATVLATTGFVHAEKTSLTIATGDYEPFTGQDLPDGGVVNGIIRQIVEQAGYQAEFNFMPWKRNLEATRRGKYDASSYWFYNPEREADFIHVGPVHEVRQVFFVRAESGIANWSSLEDLAGLRIGVVPGYTYTQEFWDLAESGVLTVSEATSDEANIKKLLAGRIDAFPISEISGWHIVKKVASPEEAEGITVLETSLVVSPGFLLLSRNSPGSEEIAASLQAVVDEHEADK